MAASFDNKHRLILNDPKDWVGWLSYIRKSVNGETWKLVDPDLPERPARLQMPALPAKATVNAETGRISSADLEVWKMNKLYYDEEKHLYEKQDKALTRVHTLILESVSARMVNHTAYTEQDPYDTLIALKQRLKPSSASLSLEVERKFHRLAKGPGNQNIEAWLDEWIDMYHEAKRRKIFEITGERAIRDFLLAVKTFNPYYASNRRGFRKNIEIQNQGMAENPILGLGRQQQQFTMEQEIESLREDYRENQTLALRNPAALATQAKPTLKGRDQEGKDKDNKCREGRGPMCLCGDKMFYSNCPYLVPSKAPLGWKEDPEKRKKVDEALKNKETKERVEGFLKRQAEKSKASSSSETANTPTIALRTEGGGAFVTTDNSAFATDISGMETLLIHDAASSVHICNRWSAHLYKKIRDSHSDEYLQSGTDKVRIESWGVMHTAFETPNGLYGASLQNVAYAANFMTSIVSGALLESKNVSLNSRGPHLFTGDDPTKVGFCLHRHGSYLTFSATGLPHPFPEGVAKIEPEPESTATNPSAYATEAIRSKAAEEWHRIMGHPSGETISHLEKSTEGIKVLESEVPKTNQCETCALTKSQRIISRSTNKSEDKTEPFHRISIDLMLFETSLNGHEWATHIACMATDFNILETHRSKSDCREFILNTIAMIKRRFKRDVVFIRSDNEGSFNTAFRDEIKGLGITLEPSSPDTPEQNGHAERKGKMLAIKARALRIEAELPHYLWVEAIHTACYLANRTPMAKHNWKTPYELVTGQKPNLSHLKVYGCKAYALKHHIPRKQKLEPRAHIGYLVGYDSTNIFRIWIPSRRKIIRSRDVLFDEDEVHSLVDPPDLLHFLSTTGDNAPYIITDRMRNALAELDAEDEKHRSTFDELFANSPAIAEKPVITEKPGIGLDGPSRKRPHDTAPNILPTPTPSLSPSPSTLGGDGDDATGLPPIMRRARAMRPLRSRDIAPQAQTISADLDDDHILPEGSKRQRTTRQNVYATQLEEVGQGSTDPFHASFAALTIGSAYRPALAFTTRIASSSERPHTRPHRDNMPAAPKGFKELARHPYCEAFKEAMRVEIKELQRKGTWEEVAKDEAIHKQSVPTMWVYKYKFDEDGWLVKHKARLVARGDLQHTNFDTYAATLAARLFRFLMALVASFDLNTRQYDAVNAFANSLINETTYCRLPPGWTGNSNVILRLLRALYGLKQSPALWHNDLSSTLIELGLEPLPGVECIYTNSYMIVFFFVDDICVIYDKRYSAYVDAFEAKLFNKYEMKALGEIEWFLGIRVTRDRASRKLWLCQDSYIDKIGAKFNITGVNAKASPLPVEDIPKFNGIATAQDIFQYQTKVGHVNFPAVITRPDIANSASKLSEHLNNPSPRHIELVNRVIGYLVSTRTLSIMFDGRIIIPREVIPKEVLIVSSDSSFADDLQTRYSSQGYAMKLFGGLIDWKANKQKTVTLSSTEAELLAISQTAKETIWWSRLFELIEFDLGNDLTIQCDNRQTIRALISENPRFSTKLRHVDIHSHWLRQEVINKRISINWVPSAQILADGFTKALPIQRHKEFINLLGLVKAEGPKQPSQDGPKKEGP